MKIQVNKNQQAINLKTHIGTIIMIADKIWSKHSPFTNIKKR